MMAIFKKEVAIYFLTPFGYVFMGLFLFISGIIFTVYNLAGARGDILGMLGVLNFVSIVVFPVLTMKLLAEEKKMATDQLLFTSAVTTASIVLGKYLAALFVFLLTLASTGLYSVFILMFSRTSPGAILGAYLGFSLLGAAYIAICLFASSLTENQVTSAIAGFGLLLGFMLIGLPANYLPLPIIKEIIKWLAILGKFEEFTNGLLKIGPLVYYFSFTILFLFFTVRVVENRQQNKEALRMKRFGANGLNQKVFLDKLNSAVILVVLIGILVMVNIIADKIPWIFDMTADRVYTLSDRTRKVLAGLEQSVKITGFFQEGAADPAIKSLLEEYRKAGRGKIVIEYLDAEKNPAAAKKYDRNNEGLANGTIVFESNGKIKKINKYEIITPNDLGFGKSFSGEQQFTGAILQLTTVKFQKVYFLEGHQEMDPNEDFFKLKSRIESEANLTERLNLLKTNSVPEDADLLIVASPKRDLNSREMQKLQDYLGKGGRAILLFDILSPGSQLSNFSNLLREYGVSIQNNFVVEEDSDSFYSNNKMYLVPYYLEHSIVAKMKLNNLFVFLPYTGNIDLLKDRGHGVTVEPLLKSSDKSWIRYNVKEATPNKTGGDKPGPANLAVAVTRDNSDLKYGETKLVIIYNAKFIMDSMLDMQGNFDLIMNAVGWVQDKKETLAIRPKILDTNRMFIKGNLSMALMILSVAVIPLIAFSAGLIVWMRRRHL